MVLEEKLKKVRKEVGWFALGLLPGMSAYSMAKGLNCIRRMGVGKEGGCLGELIPILGTPLMAAMDIFTSIGLYYDLPYAIATKENPELYIASMGLLGTMKISMYYLGRTVQELEKIIKS